MKQKVYMELGKWELFLTNLILTAGRATLQTPSKYQLRKEKSSDKASTLALRTSPIITTTCSLFLLFPKAVRQLSGTLLCSAKELCT